MANSKKTNRYLRSADGNRQFSYFAFISYKHLDKRWGRWLQHQLEGYRLPSRLCKHKEYPPRLTPIFRDETDLTAGKNVHTLLLEKLQASKFLIVICSRHMQNNPQYIDYEIEQFLAMGNPASHILPLIVDGEAASRDPQKECLPPALLRMGDARPLGVTLDPKKKHDAILKLVAAMHGLEIQSIRAHDEVRRQKRLMLALCILLCTATAAGALFTWNRLTVRQAQLREANVNAALLLNQGDRLRAEEAAQNTLSAVNPLMDPAIAEEAEKTKTLAAIHPLLSPVTRLCASAPDQTVAFAGDGKSLAVFSETTASFYALSGARTGQLSTAERDLSIVAVSPDGSRAVVQRVDSGTASLWLLDLASDEIIAPLVQSSAFDEQDIKLGRYDTVVDAVFSPDGRLVSAYRIGGYINVSEELDVFDAQTGKKCVSLDPMLLIAENDARPQPIVTGFEFISDTLLHWTGGFYHVFYDMRTGAVHQVPLRDVAVTKKSGLARYGYLTLTARTAEDGTPAIEFANHLTKEREELALSGPFLPKKSSIFGGHYALALFAHPENADRIGEALLADMGDNTLVPGWETLYTLSEGCTDITVLEAPGTSVFYLQLTNPNAWMETTVLLRVDPQSGITKLEPARHPFADADYAFAGTVGSMELLLARTETGTTAYLLDGDQLCAYTLDERFDSFSQSAIPGMLEGVPVLAAAHEGALCLYPLSHPGTQLDAGLTWDQEADALFAASQDGLLIAKAQGHAFAVFDDTACVYSGAADTRIQSLAVLEDGSRIAVASADQLQLFARDGTLLSSLRAEEGYALRGAALPAGGTRLLVLDEPTSVLKKGEYRLRLFEADTLHQIAELAGRIHPHSASAPDSISVSPDGTQVAAVERISLGDKYHRAVSIWSAQDGSLLARTTSPVDSGGAATLTILENVMAANAFSYVHYAQSGTLLAGLDSGVWVFDPTAFETVGYTFTASGTTGFPDQTPTGDIVYPCEGVQILSTDTEMLKASLPVSLIDHTTHYASLRTPGQAMLSQDGRFLAVSGTDATQLYDAASWQLCGAFANTPIRIVHLSESRAVYDTGNALYTLPL